VKRVSSFGEGQRPWRNTGVKTKISGSLVWDPIRPSEIEINLKNMEFDITDYGPIH